MSKQLFLFRHSPYGNPIAREGLEALLATAVFDIPAIALFIYDGVFQLYANQDNSEFAGKNHEKMLSSLNLYGIEDIFVHKPSLEQRGIDISHLSFEPQLVDDVEVSALFNSSKHTLSF